MLKKLFPNALFGCLTLFAAQQNTKAGQNSKTPQDDTQETGHFYVGVFGGGGGFGVSNFRQTGTIFYPASSGGTTGVTATSGGRTAGAGFVGLQLGYLWPELKDQKKPQSWELKIGTEFEGYYIGTSLKPLLGSRTVTEERFQDKFPINEGTLLAGGVLHFYAEEGKRFHPFVGGAVGAAVLTAHDATSFQQSPPEPGINHFNTNTTATAWSFAAQGKIGLMFDIDEHFKAFAEYRFLYLTPASFTFGNTRYSNHPATSNWRVRFGNMYINLGDAGIAYHF